ncbi:Translation initiation factor SUI1-related protein [hydrothermal vent metagenome]|uniref:Translation initiation factor SUI1-related protein n=1 Tax=hydrothermal vent metagenome TaxID=652676 RepID=A0A3B1D269_9ZZZZ
MPRDNSKLVYSTDSVVPEKEKATVKTSVEQIRPGQQKVRVRLDRKHRGGKSVTVIEGLRMKNAELRNLLKQLKSRLGTGGAIKDDLLEIQGDRGDTVMTILENMGYKPKRSGG